MRTSERGQATTETILLTWILLLFIAGTYQVFLMNETIFRSMTAVHSDLFKQAFSRNCYEGQAKCKYTTDTGARVIWNINDIPEARIPIVGLFRRLALLNPNEQNMILYSNYPNRAREPLCYNRPCKRTKLGSGAYLGPFDTLAWSIREIVNGEFWRETISHFDSVEDLINQLISIALG